MTRIERRVEAYSKAESPTRVVISQKQFVGWSSRRRDRRDKNNRCPQGSTVLLAGRLSGCASAGCARQMDGDESSITQVKNNSSVSRGYFFTQVKNNTLVSRGYLSCGLQTARRTPAGTYSSTPSGHIAGLPADQAAAGRAPPRVGSRLSTKQPQNSMRDNQLNSGCASGT